MIDTKQTRVVKKTVPTESFFNFFSPPKAPTEEDDDDAASDIEERLELDYQLGEDIKEKLIPRAIDWFTGEALQFEEMDDDMEEGDFADEDDEDDEDLSEDHDDDEESDDDDDAAKPKQGMFARVSCAELLYKHIELTCPQMPLSASRAKHFMLSGLFPSDL